MSETNEYWCLKWSPEKLYTIMCYNRFDWFHVNIDTGWVCDDGAFLFVGFDEIRGWCGRLGGMSVFLKWNDDYFLLQRWTYLHGYQSRGGNTGDVWQLINTRQSELSNVFLLSDDKGSYGECRYQFRTLLMYF